MDDETTALRNALIEAEKEKAGMRKRRRRQDGGEAVAGRPGPLDYLKHRVKEEPEMEAAANVIVVFLSRCVFDT